MALPPPLDGAGAGLGEDADPKFVDVDGTAVERGGGEEEEGAGEPSKPNSPPAAFWAWAVGVVRGASERSFD